MSFSKKVHRSLTFVLFTLRPGHEIDVEVLVQEEFPSLHNVLAIGDIRAAQRAPTRIWCPMAYVPISNRQRQIAFGDSCTSSR